ncbi:MAG: NAD(P)/FAD-dependent oxidoreductase [Gallionellaceae bacterium]|nr:MAG: NAD(P)/FAD-dependent oxidoreductase [Gallionellaceae bacterium]
MTSVDVLIIGAGAAGLMCAATAAQRGRSVVVLDHAHKLAEKIRISGGGRCNFTNLNTKPENYLSQNPHFCRSALARYTPQHFIALLDKHQLHYSEKALGQLFCDDGSEAIIKMLKDECDAAGVKLLLACDIKNISPLPPGEGKSKMKFSARFSVATSRGEFQAASLVIASGGLSIPKIGASPFGYKVAEQFGIPITRLHAGLVPLSFHPEEWGAYAGLAGISVDAVVSFGKQKFRESVLFTHRGLSGPAILQISSYWEHGQALHIDLLPGHDVRQIFVGQRGSRMLPDNFLMQYLPKRLAEIWCAKFAENKPLNQFSEKALAALADQLHDWQITPSGTLGYSKAEVTCGGVDTRALSSKTMQANDAEGLYFVGEVMDVTGQLGGYNFQWAWASGYAAGQVV